MAAAAKVVTREQAASKAAEVKARGGKIVFTCGVFDLIHVGHVRYLEYARSLGDFLIVGINSDASVRELGKGPQRPLVPGSERAEIVAALASVDLVCIYDEVRPNRTIALIRPDVHVKDAAYEGAELPEADAVREVGGVIRFAPRVPGHSTTEILQRLAKDAG